MVKADVFSNSGWAMYKAVRSKIAKRIKMAPIFIINYLKVMSKSKRSAMSL